jgi:hypothetical protein
MSILLLLLKNNGDYSTAIVCLTSRHLSSIVWVVPSLVFRSCSCHGASAGTKAQVMLSYISPSPCVKMVGKWSPQIHVSCYLTSLILGPIGKVGEPSPARGSSRPTNRPELVSSANQYLSRTAGMQLWKVGGSIKTFEPWTFNFHVSVSPKHSTRLSSCIWPISCLPPLASPSRVQQLRPLNQLLLLSSQDSVRMSILITPQSLDFSCRMSRPLILALLTT